jgi:hypothetical protein
MGWFKQHFTGFQFDLKIDKRKVTNHLTRAPRRCCRLVGAASELLSSSADLKGPRLRSGHMSNVFRERRLAHLKCPCGGMDLLRH